MEEQQPIEEYPFLIRKVEEHELLAFISIWAKNDLFCDHYDVLVQHFQTSPGTFIVAVRKDTREIIGTCWCGLFRGNRVLIGGITVNEQFPLILREFIFFIFRRYPNITMYDIQIPTWLSTLYRCAYWTRHWDIHLYVADTSQIYIKSLENKHEYQIETKTRVGESHIDFYVATEIQKLLNISIEDQTSKRNISFDLYQGNNLLAFASLTIRHNNIYFIRNLVASNEETAKHLLRKIFMYMKDKKLSGKVAMYVLNNKEGYNKFLKESGLIKTRAKWTRFSLNETIYVRNEMTYDDVRDKIFSSSCIICSLI